MGRYNAATGLGKLYYAVLTEEQDGRVTTSAIKEVDYVQEMSIEFGEELEKAYGSNKVAEIAKSAGETQLSLTFHKLPIDVQKDLLGLIAHESAANTYGFGKSTGITYATVAIPRTMEDGSMEWFGLSKGVFTRPNKEGKTKEDGVEFGSDEIEGQFMERKVEGFDEELAVMMSYDPKGSTEGRDAVFQSMFGKGFETVQTGSFNNAEDVTITIEPSSADVKVDSTVQLRATVSPEDAIDSDDVTFESSNTEVATVDEKTGLVTGVSEGEARIAVGSASRRKIYAQATVRVTSNEI
ncbi:Ig-like domain-containing protein [Staphylococcus chromogenes]|uniref:major tail protein n=1 Tax=Staphylococcus chromogenes TaxID=46126 RepID=UPI0028FF80D0|nr:major tail protein [Staphylococcus chromogenes]MDU0430640.1 Ig-like domain-containing protein [Staphylococcus chromogenes]